RRQRPAAVRVGGPVRDRRGVDDLDLPRGRQLTHRRRLRRDRGAPLRRGLRSGSTNRERRRAGPGGGARYARWRAMSETVTSGENGAAGAAPTQRIHVTRSRAKPGGTAQTDGAIPFKRARKPPWLKVPAPGGPNYRRLKEKIGSDNLHTVCEEANCPNV